MGNQDRKSLPAPFVMGNMLTEKLFAVGEIMEEIESCTDDELPALLKETFSRSIKDLKSNVDLAYFVFEDLKAQEEQARVIGEQFIAKAKRIDAAMKQMKESVKGLMEQEPGLKLEGEVGRMRLQANAEGLHLNFTTKPKTIYGAVSEEDIFYCGIPAVYLDKTVTYKLKTDEIRADLKAGMELKWARLERGQHVRIEARAPKKKEVKNVD